MVDGWHLLQDSAFTNDPLESLRNVLNVPFRGIQFFQLVRSVEFIIYEKNSNYTKCNFEGVEFRPIFSSALRLHCASEIATVG